MLLKGFLTQGSFHAPCGKHVLLLLDGGQKGESRKRRNDANDDDDDTRICSLIENTLGPIQSGNDVIIANEPIKDALGLIRGVQIGSLTLSVVLLDLWSVGPFTVCP